MLVPLRHVARFLRLALVCLALVWNGAPSAAGPITDAIVLVAVERAAEASRARPAEPSEHATRGAEPALRVSAAEHLAGTIRAACAPRPPRRIYLDHRALLC